MKRYSLLLLFTFFALSILKAQGENNFPDATQREKAFDLVYKIKDGDTLKLIFRYPTNFKKSKKYPAIIFFFGGGWNGGKVSQFQPQAEYFASRGMISVLADYRVKSRHKTTPYEAVNDAKSAIRFLRQHAKELNINSKKIVASGGSAGGHLAAACGNLLGLDEPDEDLSISSKANALVLFNPVFDNGPDGFVNERMGKRWQEISPAHNIRKGAPPTIVFLGTKDKLIPVEIAENYKAKMEAVGSRCDLHLYKGQKHGFFNQKKDSHEYYNKTVREADLFLISLKYLKGKPGSFKEKPLDLNSYWEVGIKEQIYPTPKQLDMLKKRIPETTFQPAPPISDRNYWNKIATTESGKEYLENALSELEVKPEVPITDSIYRRANKEGNRRIYKPRYYRTMTRLEHFTLAECIENKGRFLPQISVYLNAIMDMKSWLHPNHDDSENGVLEGRRVSIDLGARRFGSDLALTQVLLEDKLSSDLREKIAIQLRWRITESYLTSCKENNENNRWIKSSSNWNSVCTSGSMFVTIAASQDANERLAAVGSALNSMKYYLAGFGDDGYCSEGAGYWNYGFGHYLYLAQILYDYTDGSINLFEAGNPEKLENVGNFPERYQIHKGICAPISDGVSRVSNDGGFAYNMSAKHFGARMPTNSRKSKSHDSYSAAYQLIEWTQMGAAVSSGNKVQSALKLPNYTYFDHVGMVISRGKQEVPLSIAIKAGHNKENHNHSDVGTYVIVLNRDIMTGDIGAPSYIAGAFSPDNPARSSWGHPVPRIDNKLQSNGIEFAGKITTTEFAIDRDKVVMNLKNAYEIPSLKSLTRTMENDKSGQGTITIVDQFSSTEPVAFGIAIMTLSDYEIIDSNTVILTTENQKLKAKITSEGGSFTIKDELVPVEKLREGAPAYRIGIDFIKPISKGSIAIEYKPLLD